MSESRPDRVYFYGTCLIDLFEPEAGLAAIELIEREGIAVDFPRDQSCCGQPAWNAGYRREAWRVITAQLELFADDTPIVVPSASCAGMMRHHWPEAFPAGSAQADRACRIAARVVEWSDFMERVVDPRWPRLAAAETVVLHDSCSARREMAVAGQARALLERLGVTVREPERAEECCGFGGSFSVKQADISGAMLADKLAAIEASADAGGARCLLSQDCGCLMHIGGGLRHRGRSLSSLHVAEYIRERLREAGQ